MHLNFLLTVLVLLLHHNSVVGVQKTYIVHLSKYHDDERHLTAAPDIVAKSHHQMLSTLSTRNLEPSHKLIYSYSKVFNGFAAVLHKEQAKELQRHPDVTTIYKSKFLKLQTTYVSKYLGLEQNHEVVHQESLWKHANFGEDLLLAHIDSGCTPEAESFSDKEGYGPIPKKFKGSCDIGNDPTFRCNRKLIGARYFSKGFTEGVREFSNGSIMYKAEENSRDWNGHGTNTLGMSGGSKVVGASYLGYENGTSKGVAPRVRLISYKSCWKPPPELPNIGMCSTIDTMAAIEAAIEDDVDVINISQGGGGQLAYYEDPNAIGTFFAVKHGIPVIFGAGNDGPLPSTVVNLAPWVITVGATTIDRAVDQGHIILGNKLDITGKSLSVNSSFTLPSGEYPLISSVDASATNNVTEASLCKPRSLDQTKVKGRILLCLRGDIPKIDKASEAARAGAVGMILANLAEFGVESNIVAERYVIPTTHVTYRDGIAILNYINSTRSPTASFNQQKTEYGIKPAPQVAAFSSRGPNIMTPGILKPDIVAPGERVLVPSQLTKERPFEIQDGTSFSAPVVSGVVALLKKMYPHWSPAAIKSAIMTTATTKDNMGEPIREQFSLQAGTPFSYGSGFIRPNLAMDPGLVYDLKQHDYLDFLCAHGLDQEMLKAFWPYSKIPYHCPSNVSVSDLNIPSITVPDLSGTATVTRKLKNVAKQPSTYTARIEAPRGVSITVEPKVLRYSKYGQEIHYKLTFKALGKELSKDYSFGSVEWSDGKHIVRSPIVIKPKSP